MAGQDWLHKQLIVKWPAVLGVHSPSHLALSGPYHSTAARGTTVEACKRTGRWQGVCQT